MTRVLVACVSALAGIALAGAAAAADLPPRYGQPIPKAPPMYPAIYNWTGFYLGINGGGGFGHSTWDSTGGFDVSGGVVGGTIGYNWQTGPWVFGLEGDIDWSNISGSTNVLCPLGCTTRNDWLGTARGRVGYAFDRIMPYLTGGLAFGNIKAATPFLPGKDETNAGWTIGGGLEVALTGNWSAKAEYLYVDLGKTNCGLGCSAFVVDNASFTTHLLRGGVNYRF
jgi:outer membrane immunogenic protein